MTKEIFARMLAGLSPEEQKTTLAELGVVDATAQAELIGMAAAQANNVTVQPPTINMPAPVLPAPVLPAPAAVAQTVQPSAPTPAASAVQGQDVTTLMAQLANERTARITAECDAFVSLNANKIPPTEVPSVKALYATLAGMTDNNAALNAYKATIDARPINPMLREAVASATITNGGVILSGSQSVDTRTEDEKEAAAIGAFLGMTEVGQQSAVAAKTGSVTIQTTDGKIERPVNLAKAFEQFAIKPPVGV